MSQIKTIIVFRHGLLGDHVVAVPALELLRKNFSEAKIIYCSEYQVDSGHRLFSETLHNLDLIDEFTEFSFRVLGPFLTLVVKLMLMSRRSTLIVNLEKVGWSDRRERFCRWLGFVNVVGPVQRPIEVSLSINQMLSDIALLASSRFKTIQGKSFFRSSHHELPEKLIAKLPQENFLCVTPWSNMDCKRWPEKNFRSLVESLLEFDVNIVLLGGRDKEEIKLGEKLAYNHRITSLVGKTSVWESYLVLQMAYGFIGNDTGTLHLAALAKCNWVGLYSHREYDAKLWAPISNPGVRGQVLVKNVICRGCQERTCPFVSSRCIDEIKVGEVVRAAKENFYL